MSNPQTTGLASPSTVTFLSGLWSSPGVTGEGGRATVMLGDSCNDQESLPHLQYKPRHEHRERPTTEIN